MSSLYFVCTCFLVAFVITEDQRQRGKVQWLHEELDALEAQLKDYVPFWLRLFGVDWKLPNYEAPSGYFWYVPIFGPKFRIAELTHLKLRFEETRGNKTDAKVP